MAADLAKAQLVVNTSGIGVEEGASPSRPICCWTGLFVLDLVLNHDLTPLMRDAQARGGTVANGQPLVPGRLSGDVPPPYRPGSAG